MSSSGSYPLGGDHHRGLGDLFIRWSTEFKEAEIDFHEFSWGRQALVVIASISGGLFLIVGAFPAFVWTVKILKPGEDNNADKVSDVTSSWFSRSKGATKGTKETSISTKTRMIGPSKTRLEVGVEVFGKDFWNKELAMVVDEPDLAVNINQILQEDCRFVAGKKVWETHDLVLIPGDFSMENLPNVMHSKGLTFEESLFGNLPDIKQTSKSCWVLVTKNPVSNFVEQSRDDPQLYGLYEDIHKLLRDKGLPYKISSLRDTAIIVVARWLKGEKEISCDVAAYSTALSSNKGHVVVELKNNKINMGSKSERAYFYKNPLFVRTF